MSPAPLQVAVSALALPTAAHGIEEQRRLRDKPPIEVAREFEAILLAQVIGAMRQTIPNSGVLQAAAAHRMLDGAFDQEVARSLVAHADFGIATQIAAQIERQGNRHQQSRAQAATAGLIAVPLRARGADVGGSRPPIAEQEIEVAVPPVSGRMTSRFGVRRDPITGLPEFHAGIDLAARRGARVHAVASGEVVFAGRRGGAGNVIDVRHAGNLVTSYAHVARTLVRAGQKVAAGDVVATVGSTGRATGPHLHFAARRNGQLIDPTGLLRGNPVNRSPQIVRGRTPSGA
jgi:murein DD-endopeptidase MepM/ murein hydrolase activator NlpD